MNHNAAQAEELCGRDVSCKGFEYPTQRQPGQVCAYVYVGVHACVHC